MDPYFANEKAKRSFNEVHGYFTLRRNTRRYLLGGKAANVYPNRAAKYGPKRGSQNNVHAPQVGPRGGGASRAQVRLNWAQRGRRQARRNQMRLQICSLRNLSVVSAALRSCCG